MAHDRVGPLTMPTFDAIGIVTTDMAACLAFYRLLGLEFDDGAEAAPHVEAELAGGFRLLIDPVSTVESFSSYDPPTGGRAVGFAFSCSSPAEVDATFERVVAAGHPVKEEPFDAFWGQRYATVIDPDGNPVDLYAALAPTPGKPMSPELMDLVRRPNFAHLATLRTDGSPKLDPIWIDVVDEHTLVMATGMTSLKTRNIQHDPRVAISIVDKDNPYEEAQIRGLAVVEPDTDMAGMDAISHQYIGAPFPMRDNMENRVLLKITVTQSRYANLPFEHTPPS
ncbi:MAG: TIGR03618 family F420-dependent PPOX class oxidoreductase [Actinomycetia bacterium]|nr:TIGR03618 family F420-dependent PPOX class oxidoreductase [Actinomycetes bacterium]